MRVKDMENDFLENYFREITELISSVVGHKSLKNTSLPFLSFPIESFCTSIVILPANA